MKNVQQRFETILRVSNAIAERQKNFFSHGEIAMKPLVLREIADELDLHESTISRVTTAKYMSTPFGTYELKYFFGSSLATEAGGNASSTAVRALIKQFVAAEDAKKPLSDSQLANMLEEQGIQVARRTVAKYREALKIAQQFQGGGHPNASGATLPRSVQSAEDGVLYMRDVLNPKPKPGGALGSLEQAFASLDRK